MHATLPPPQALLEADDMRERFAHVGIRFDPLFNPMPGLDAQRAGPTRAHLRNLLPGDPVRAPIRVAEPCHGCTVGR